MYHRKRSSRCWPRAGISQTGRWWRCVRQGPDSWRTGAWSIVCSALLILTCFISGLVVEEWQGYLIVPMLWSMAVMMSGVIRLGRAVERESGPLAPWTGGRTHR